MTAVMPVQKPGRSQQDVETPDDFLAAVKKRLGITEFLVDLAASAANAKAPRFLTKEVDALRFDWTIYAGRGWCWLNPPFGKIPPFAHKNVAMQPLHIAFLTPASTGANWFVESVAGWARVLMLQGRLTFVGHEDAYPKDCILSLYGPGIVPGYEVWDWRKDVPK